jgi:hypothetical protein
MGHTKTVLPFQVSIRICCYEGIRIRGGNEIEWETTLKLMYLKEHDVKINIQYYNSRKIWKLHY